MHVKVRHVLIETWEETELPLLPTDEEALRNLTIVEVGEEMPFVCESDIYACYDHGNRIVYVRYNVPEVVMHGMLHALLYRLDYNADRTHSDPVWRELLYFAEQKYFKKFPNER